MAKKKVSAVVKIQIPAGGATPAPPVGTALGPHGVAIMDFCKEYNAKTEAQRGTIVPVEITIYEDRSFTFILKTPPTSVLIKQAAGLDKGSPDPARRPSPARSPRRRSRRSPRSRCPTSTPTTSRPPASRSPAPPARWASRSSDPPARHRRAVSPTGTDLARRAHRTTTPPRWPVVPDTREPSWRSTERSTPTRPVGTTAPSSTPRPRPSDLVKSLATAKFDETVELGRAPGRRSPQGRPDGAWHRGPALRHRQRRPRRRVRPGRRRRRGP